MLAVAITSLQLFNMMVEKRKATLFGRIVEHVMTALDVFQTVMLLLNAKVAHWPTAPFDWLSGWSFMAMVIPDRSSTLFLTVWIMAVLIVLFSVAVAAFSFRMLLRTSISVLWPLKVLRAVVTTLATAGFIPLTELLLIPLHCGSLQDYMGAQVAGWSCFQGNYLFLTVLSSLALLTFLPLVLLSALLLHSDEPNTRLLSSKPSGRIDMYDTVMRLFLVAGSVYLPDNEPGLYCFLAAVGYAAMAAYTMLHLPMFEPRAFHLKGSAYALFSWLALGAFILHGAFDTSELLAMTSSDGWAIASYVWLGMGVAVAALGYYGTQYRERFMLRLAKQVGAEPLEDAGPHELAGQPMESGAVAASDTSEPQLLAHSSGQGNGGHMRHIGSAEQLAQVGSHAELAGLAAAVKQYHLIEIDVELLARLLLTEEHFQPGHVELAERIFQQGLVLFPESVYVRVAYVRFILTYQMDTFQALGLLQAATRQPSTLDRDFLVYRRLQKWQAKRQSDSVGDTVDSLAMIQFNKLLSEAKEHHRLAMTHLFHFWRDLYRVKVKRTAVLSNVTIVRTLRHLTESRNAADSAYMSLREKFPNSRQLLRSHALLYGHVFNDEHSKLALLSRAEEDSSAGGVSKSSEAQSSSDQGSRAQGSDNAAGPQHSLVQRFAANFVENVQLQQFRRWFRSSSALLIACTAGLYGAMVTTLYLYTDTLATLDAAGLRRSFTQSGFYCARGMQLAALNYDNATIQSLRLRLLSEMRQLYTGHQWLYYQGSRSALLTEQFTQPAIDFVSQVYNTTLHHKYGLWDAVNVFAARGTAMAQLSDDELRAAPNASEWRFVIDNSLTTLFPELDHAVALYQQYDETLEFGMNVGQCVLLALMVVISMLLAAKSLFPAIRAVQAAKASVIRVVSALSAGDIQRLYRRVREVQRLYERLDTVEGSASNVIIERKLMALTMTNFDTGAQDKQSAENSGHSEEDQSDQSDLEVIDAAEEAKQAATKAFLMIQSEHASDSDDSSMPSLAEPRGQVEGTAAPQVSVTAQDQAPLPQTSSSNASSLFEALDHDDECASQLSGVAEAAQLPAGLSEEALAQHNQALSSSMPPRRQSRARMLMQSSTRVIIDTLHAADSSHEPEADNSTPLALPGTLSEGDESMSTASRACGVDSAQGPLRVPAPHRVVMVNTAVPTDQPNSVLVFDGSPSGRTQSWSKSDSASRSASPANAKPGTIAGIMRPQMSSISDTSSGSSRHTIDRNAVARDRQVIALRRRVWLGLFAMLGVYVSNLLIVLELLRVGGRSATELNYAGRRRSFARELVNSAREVVVGDETVFSRSQALDRLSFYRTYYEQIHFGLRMGDARLGLDGSDGRNEAKEAVLYGRSDSSFTYTGDVYQNIVSQSVNDMLLTYFQAADGILTRYADTTAPRTGLNQSLLFEVPEFKLMYELERGELGRGLNNLVNQYRIEGDLIIEDLQVYMRWLLVGNLSAFVMLYYLIFKPAVAAVVGELQRRTDVLGVIPQEVALRTRRLRRFYSNIRR